MFDIDNNIKKMLGKNNKKSSTFNFGNTIKNVMGPSKKFGGKRDWDGDGVINKRDCQPRNVMRQDNIKDRIYVGQIINTEDFTRGRVVSKTDKGITVKFLDNSIPARELLESFTWVQVRDGLKKGWIYLPK